MDDVEAVETALRALLEARLEEDQGAPPSSALHDPQRRSELMGIISLGCDIFEDQMGLETQTLAERDRVMDMQAELEHEVDILAHQLDVSEKALAAARAAGTVDEEEEDFDDVLREVVPPDVVQLLLDIETVELREELRAKHKALDEQEWRDSVAADPEKLDFFEQWHWNLEQRVAKEEAASEVAPDDSCCVVFALSKRPGSQGTISFKTMFHGTTVDVSIARGVGVDKRAIVSTSMYLPGLLELGYTKLVDATSDVFAFVQEEVWPLIGRRQKFREAALCPLSEQ